MPSDIILTVDVVLLTLQETALKVLLMRRENPPYAGQLALPGGYVHPEEDSDTLAAARRMLLAKTGITSPYLEQLYSFSGGVRDPRGWSVSVTYFALLANAEVPLLNPGLQLADTDDLPNLSFDHKEIVNLSVRRVREKSAYSALPCYLLPEHFTLTELQQTYEKMLNTRLDKSAFRRKISEWDFLEIVPDAMKIGVHRPAQFYRIKPGQRLKLFDRTV